MSTAAVAAAASKKKKVPAKKSSAEPRFATYARAIHKQRFGNAPAIWAPAVTNLDELACYLIDALGEQASEVLDVRGTATLSPDVGAAACELFLTGAAKDAAIQAGEAAVAKWRAASPPATKAKKKA